MNMVIFLEGGVISSILVDSVEPLVNVLVLDADIIEDPVIVVNSLEYGCYEIECADEAVAVNDVFNLYWEARDG